MAEKDRIRTKDLRVKLSEDEYATIWLKANEADITISDAIRYLIVYGKIYVRGLDEKSQEKLDDFNELLSKIRNVVLNIGNNINQITYNTYPKYMATEEDLKQVYAETCLAEEAFLQATDEVRSFIEEHITK
jgi:hypothetical protein